MDVKSQFKEWVPPVVCLCGSTRFMEQFQKANLELTMAGKIVLSVGCDTKSDADLQLTPEKKAELDKLHLKKIEISDEVIILNVDGYVGPSTARELAFARWLGKKISFLETIPILVNPPSNIEGCSDLLWDTKPKLGMDSVFRILNAAKDMRHDPCVIYHFKGSKI